MVLAGNKKFVEGDYLPRSGEGRGGRPTKPGEGDGEDAFRFVLSRDEFVDLFLDDLELPNLAKRKLAEAESEGLRRFVMTVVTACSMSCWFTSRISWLTSRSPRRRVRRVKLNGPHVPQLPVNGPIRPRQIP